MVAKRSLKPKADGVIIPLQDVTLRFSHSSFILPPSSLTLPAAFVLIS